MKEVWTGFALVHSLQQRPDGATALVTVRPTSVAINFHSGWDVAEWLERLTANAKVATVLGSIPASSVTVESEGRQMKQCWIQYKEKNLKNPPVNFHVFCFYRSCRSRQRDIKLTINLILLLQKKFGHEDVLHKYKFIFIITCSEYSVYTDVRYLELLLQLHVLV